MRILPAQGVVTLAVVPVLAALLVPLPTQTRTGEKKTRMVVQPIEFSHRVHAELGTKCRFCHPSARTESKAGLPSSVVCMVCHKGIRLESAGLGRLFALHQRGEVIPWVRQYVLAADTFFSHRYHVGAGARCSDCHGRVEEKETLADQEPMSMAACVGCHLSDGVPTDCGFCHALGVIPPDPPQIESRKP